MRYKAKPNYQKYKKREEDKTLCWGRCSFCRGYKGSTTHEAGYKKELAKEKVKENGLKEYGIYANRPTKQKKPKYKSREEWLEEIKLVFRERFKWMKNK